VYTKTLYAGPWTGEFGWELCWWNPMIRYYAQQYEHITVAAPEGSRYLYEFADEFIPLKTIGISYCDGYLLSDLPIIKADVKLSPHEEFAKYPNEPDRISTPRKWKSLVPSRSVYIADILCAFRPKKFINKKLINGKEYPLEQCQELVDLLKTLGFSVACFGGLDNYCPNGAIDLRGQPLEGQCSAISAAKCVVGPSSGTIHLASLCKCPHVTWIASTHYTLGKRYKRLWNPFDTPVRFLGHGGIPSITEILDNVVGIKR